MRCVISHRFCFQYPVSYHQQKYVIFCQSVCGIDRYIRHGISRQYRTVSAHEENNGMGRAVQLESGELYHGSGHYRSGRRLYAHVSKRKKILYNITNTLFEKREEIFVKKRVLSALLCLSMIVCMVPMLALAADTASGTCGDNITWSLGRDGTLTISGTGEMVFEEAFLSSPWQYYNQQIKKVSIEEGITSIGESAFWYCKNLMSVDISNSVTSIEDNAFGNCEKLTDVKLPNGLTHIGWEAFTECDNLTDIIIPNSVTTVESSAFHKCEKLKSVTLSNQMNEIPAEIFSGCQSLENISIPNSVSKIGKAAFKYCTSLQSVTIPDSVKEIEDSAFAGCEGLTNIVIPNSVTKIGENAFSTCKSLKEIKLPDDLASIESHVFYDCESFTDIIIPNGVSQIDRCAFGYCKNLKNVSIPNSVTYIGERAFVNCPALKEVTVPASVTEIKDDAFGVIETFDEEENPAGSQIQKDFLLITEKGSAAEKYCRDYQLACETGQRFADVDETAYYAQPVQWAVRRGITNGTADTTFSPDAVCTRAQIVTFLWRAMGSKQPFFDTYSTFTDVSEDAYYYEAMLWAIENGITKGTSNTTFSPNAPCTRAQAMTFLWRAEGEMESSAVNPFRDVNTSAYYMDAVLWAVENDITKGTSDVEFSPDALCTRGQIATFLYRDMA